MADICFEASDESNELCAVVAFKRPFAHMSRPPNDEAFEGHPLASRGLKPYSVFEVEKSSWVGAVERMIAAHPYHRTEPFSSFKFFIFSLHDSTFGCVADAFSIVLCRGSVWRVLRRAADEA